MTYLEKAEKAGYVNIIGTGKKSKITYVTSDNHTENYNDPEEKVRAEFWAELIYKYDYPANRINLFPTEYRQIALILLCSAMTNVSALT